MATVTADYQERRRIVFEARGRQFTNVREEAEDGPIGYTSTELLLIALGNCTLGAFLKHDLLRDAPVTRARATLEAETVPNPTRIDAIHVTLDLQVADPALLEHHEALEIASCECPLCNTLGDRITTRLQLSCVD